MMQHFLQGCILNMLFILILTLYTNSEIYYIKHLIKFNLSTKGVDSLNSPSIFKDRSAISSISTYFENKKSPIIFISTINL